MVDKAAAVLVVSSEFGRLNLQIPAHGLLNRGGAKEISVQAVSFVFQPC